MMSSMKGFLRRFRDDTRGVVAFETVVIFPIVFWMFLATYVFFDGYRQNSVSLKAAYTISDMLSRETNVIDDTYLDNTVKLIRELTHRQDSEVSLRVSVVTYDSDDDKYLVDWSQVRGDKEALASPGIANWNDRLPVLPDNEKIIVVETWTYYDPPFNIGLEDRELRTYVFVRPRFAPQLVWKDPTQSS